MIDTPQPEPWPPFSPSLYWKEAIRRLAEAGKLSAPSVQIPKYGPGRINSNERPHVWKAPT